MGEKKLKNEIITMEELIEAKYFDSKDEIYGTPDAVLPRVRKAGKICRPLRFYWKDVENLFAPAPKNQASGYLSDTAPKPSINFKKRKR